MNTINGKTLSECKALCEQNVKCKSVEFANIFRYPVGASGQLVKYGDCRLFDNGHGKFLVPVSSSGNLQNDDINISNSTLLALARTKNVLL